MSNREEHDRTGLAVGGLVGVLAALLDPQTETLGEVVASGLGGALGGIGGSRLPDVLEPPTSSWHRSTMHSVTVSAAVTAASVGPVRRFANGVAAAPPEASASERYLRAFARGALVGAPAGYVSHVALDATTPRSVPLVTRRF